MSYCLSPGCPNPENLIDAETCQACGSPLLLRGRYRVLHALGQGGFGATYLARDEVLPGQPNCVIKQLRPNTTAPHVMQMARELFEREAETLGRIGNHPQVPRLLDYFESSQEFYLVQEYVSGSTIQQEVKRHGCMGELKVKHFLSEILPVLDYIHSQQVIHRDIKPANLIRRSHDQKLVLIDFGAVKNHVQTMVSGASENTAFTSYAIGTPGFAPPEQMAMRPVFASDIYALGVTCIYMFTGKAPKDLAYDPMTGEMLWRQHVQVSEHFATVLSKMLEISVRHRYQSASEVFRALDLEPYLESLTGNITTVRNPNSPNSNSPTTLPSSVGGLSPAARAAMAIQARQQQAKEGTSLQSAESARQRSMAARSISNSMRTGDSKGRGNGTTSSGTAGRTPTPARLEAADIQNYYGKGRRDFASHRLERIQLPRTDLAEANFHQSNLKQANFQGAVLTSVDFGRANLQGVNLRDASLMKVYMSNADLQDADLRGADLRGAYLLNANLRGANLGGANLTGAKVTPEQLAMAKTNWMTVKPNGKRGSGW